MGDDVRAEKLVVMVSPLVLKAGLTCALVGLASWIARRRGPGIGGLVASLPLTSAPVMLALALEQGPSFAAKASNATLLALLSLVASALAYAWSARHVVWPLSGLAACAAYLAVTWFLQFVSASLSVTFLVAVALLTVGAHAMPTDTSPRRVLPLPPWDLPLRMILAAVVVVALTATAARLGARLSGLLTPFPIVATSLAVFVHRFDGPAAAGQFLRSMLTGLRGFAIFFFVIGVSIEHWTIGTTFAAATLASLCFHPGLWRSVHDRVADRSVCRGA